MSVIARGKKFQASVTVRGVRYRREFETHDLAKTWEAETRARMMRGESPVLGQTPGDSAAPQTMQQLFDKTYARYWANARSERTSCLNGQAVVRLLGDTLPPAKVDSARIDALILALEAQGNSGGTVNRKLCALSKMLTFAHERGWIPRKPKIERRREAEHRIRFLTQDEESQLMQAFNHLGNPGMADLVVMLVDTGLRLSEALNSTWADLQDGWVRVWVNKGDKPRSIPMTTRVVEMLARRHGLDPASKGPFGQWSRFQVTHFWNQSRRLLGFEDDQQFIPHTLRHTFVSRLVQRGVNLKVVQELAGHKSISVTMRYAHLAPGHLVDAVKVLEQVTRLDPPDKAQRDSCVSAGQPEARPV